MPNRVRILALTGACALLLAACGSLVEPLPQDAGFAGGAVPGTVPTQGGTLPLPGTSTGPVTTNPLPGDPGTVPPPVTLDPRAAQCKSGGATDTGVTKDRIKLGLISSLTGPLPGQFDSAVQAVDAYFKGINEQGGICGRLVQLIIKDDSGDGATNLRVAEELAEEEKIFAFVGSHSAPDDSGIAKVSKREKIPDIGFALTWERAENPYTYGVPGQLQRRTIGEGASGSKYLNEVNDIEQVAIFWLKESEVSILNAWAFEAAMIKSTNGRIQICHEQPSGVLDNNYSNYVIAMKGKCDPAKTAVYTTMENNANIKLAVAMKTQSFKPKVYAPTFSSYLPSFIEDAQGSTEGAYIAVPQVPFERLQQPQSAWTPGTYELAKYVQTLKRHYQNHKPPGSWGGPAWGSAMLFTEAAVKCGAQLTRKCFFNKVDAMDSFGAGGMVVPNIPREHHIYTADLLIQVRNGQFVEVRPNDRSGPPGGPDFWDESELINWQKYYCRNRDRFPNPQEKDTLIDEC